MATLLTDNLCLTKEDIAEDSGKTNTTVNVANALFFQTCKNTLVTVAGCPGGNDGIIPKFRLLIDTTITHVTIANGKTFTQKELPITVGGSTILAELIVSLQAPIPGEQKRCFYVRDNFGFPSSIEKFILASFYDEGSRSYTLGTTTIREFLDSLYGGPRPGIRGSTCQIDLLACGFTTFPNSFLIACWDPTGGGVTPLLDNEILFTLQLGAQSVNCVFTYNLNAGGNYTKGPKRHISAVGFIDQNFTDAANAITTAVPGISPVNVAYFLARGAPAPTVVTADDLKIEFILACFNGNAAKNAWFNKYAQYLNFIVALRAFMNFFILLGCFIQVGKAIGDGSFAFNPVEVNPVEYGFATTDLALCIRLTLERKRSFFVTQRGQGVGRVTWYLTFTPKPRPQLKPDLTIKKKSRESVSVKKTESMMSFNSKQLATKIYKKVTKKLKTLTRHRWIRQLSGRLVRVRQRGGGGAEVPVIWNGVTINVPVEIGETINQLKEKLAVQFDIDKVVMTTLPLKIIINGKIMKDDEPIAKIPKKITILGSQSKTEQITPPPDTASDTASDTAYDTAYDTVSTEKNSSDLKEIFTDDTEKYLIIIGQLFNNFVKLLSDVKTILSELNDPNTDTFIHDNSKFRVDKNTFNLNVKIICVDTVIKFLKLIVEKIGNDVVGNDVVGNDVERRKLAETVANNIVIKELVFNIYNVFVNIPYGDTLVVPKPNTPGYMCGIPTTGLIEGCVKLLSYLDGIPDFPEDFFKPIDDEIVKLNENTGTTGKTYTRYTIFSDTDSQPITASSLQKRNIQTPFYIFLLDTLKKELEKYRKLGSIDNDNYKGLVNDINRLLSTESPQMERYELYNEISKMLAQSSAIINYYDLLLMIVSSYIDDALIAIVIRNELFRLISIHGTYIFDIKIIEAFIDGLDVNESMGSIIYNRGFDTIDALINIKQYFDGYVIDALNDYGFSLKEIGDFMNNLISEVKEQDLTQDLTDEQIDQLISTSLDPIFQQLEQKEQIQQRLDTDPLGLKQEATSTTELRRLVAPVTGGNNKHRSKHNANYRKKYKKFVNKYIVKKKRNKNKYNTKKSNKNKTRKNKKSKKPKSKRVNKTVKKTKRKPSHKSKFNSNHKSKHNKKVNTNYYNLYKHSKTQKH